MRNYKTAQPLIGIFPYGVTVGREVTEGIMGGEVGYFGGQPSREGAPLNGDHVRGRRLGAPNLTLPHAAPSHLLNSRSSHPQTHFLLVDDGKLGGAAWGGEIALRAGIEGFVSRLLFNIPIVQLVVQGGPGTIATVRATAEEGSPIVVCIDSGGAATAIYEFIENDYLDEKFVKQREALTVLLRL